MNERIAILNNIRKSRELKINLSINSNSEVYGACRHRPKFHRYTCCPTSADEGRSPERSEMECSNANPSVQLADITNLPVCQLVDEFSNKSVSTDSESRYSILSVDV